MPNPAVQIVPCILYIYGGPMPRRENGNLSVREIEIESKRKPSIFAGSEYLWRETNKIQNWCGEGIPAKINGQFRQLKTRKNKSQLVKAKQTEANGNGNR